MRHVTLWGAWYGSRNVGDQALLLAISRILRENLGEVRISVLTDDAEHVDRYAAAEAGCEVRAIASRRQPAQLVAALARSDALVIGGGVPFYGQPYHVGVMSSLVGLARLVGTPYATWSVATQDISSRFAQRRFAKILEGARFVTYRDPLTAERFRKWGARRDMLWAADPVFRLDEDPSLDAGALLEEAGCRTADRPLVAIICRALRAHSGFTGEHYTAKSAGTIDAMHASFAAAIDWAWEHGYRPLLIPMNTVAPDDDREPARRARALARHGGEALLIERELRPRMVPAILRRCELALSARLHGLVLAMVANCPMVGYAYGPKIAGIMQTMGMGEFVLIDETATPEAMMQTLGALDAGKERLRPAMAKRLVELQASALLPGEKIAAMLDGTQTTRSPALAS